MFRGAKLVRCLAMLTGLLSVWPSHAAAQATINPTRAQFNASTDHSATDGSGTALVQSYEIGLYIVGASQPFQTVSIGKPNPDGTGTITVDMTAAFLGWPIVGTNYTADAAAVGPGGAAREHPLEHVQLHGRRRLQLQCVFNVGERPCHKRVVHDNGRDGERLRVDERQQ